MKSLNLTILVWLVGLSISTSLVAQNLPAPTPRTTEWRFDGNTNAVFGPGTLSAEGDAVNTDTFTAADIGGQTVNVLDFTQRQSNADGYTGRTGIDGNLDGGDPEGVDQFTMVMDIRFNDDTQPYMGIWNGSASNSNDAEFFIRPDTGGFWTPTTGTIGDGTLTLNQWHRIVYVNDWLSGFTDVFVDGQFIFTAVPADYVWDGDPDPFWFLTDNTTPGETGSGQIAAFAFVDAILSFDDVIALGAPDADGFFDGAAVTVVTADEFTVFRGFHIGGTLEDSFASDDSRLLFNPGFVLNSGEAPVWLIFDGTLPSDSPGTLAIVNESQAGTPGITGATEAWNWQSSAYDIVDVTATGFNNDIVVNIDLTAQIGNYVQPGTGAVRTRIGWRRTGLTINFPWEVRLDQLVWQVN